MLGVEEMRSILLDLDYRPGWSLSILEDPFEGPYLRIVAPVHNSYRDEGIDLGIDTYISPNDSASREAFLRFVIWRLVRIESHESREFLRWKKGGAVFDPHTPVRPADAA